MQLPRRVFLLAPCAATALAQPATVDSRKAFLQMLARPQVPLAATSRLLEENESWSRFHFQFASQATQRVPGLLVKPKSAMGKLPVVVALHGTGGTKEGQLPLLERLAALGFLGVAIDGRYHGERTTSGKGSAEYVAAMLRTYRGSKERPFLYDTVWDVLRLVDYLTARPDVDASRIGMIGFSKGGMELVLAAAVDPRIAVSIPCIGVQSYRWALDNDAWQSRVGTFQAAVEAAANDEGKTQIDAAFVRKFYDRVAPGLYGEFDGPRMLPLTAPRPMLAINGEKDARTPLPGLAECVTAAKRAYADQGASARFAQVIQPNTGHKVTPEAMETAMQWFQQWLPTTVTRGAL